MIKMSQKRIKRATSIAIGLVVTFVANEWIKTYLQFTGFKRWIYIFVVLLVLTGVIYFILDKDGNF